MCLIASAAPFLSRLPIHPPSPLRALQEFGHSIALALILLFIGFLVGQGIGCLLWGMDGEGNGLANEVGMFGPGSSTVSSLRCACQKGSLPSRPPHYRFLPVTATSTSTGAAACAHPHRRCPLLPPPCRSWPITGTSTSTGAAACAHPHRRRLLLPPPSLQVLAYYGYVNLNWRSLRSAVGTINIRATDGCVTRLYVLLG